MAAQLWVFPEVTLMAGTSSFGRFWPRRRRASGPHHATSRSLSRRHAGLAAERLEDRRLLAATPADPFEQGLSDICVMPAVTPAWFASLADDPASPPTGAGSAASIMIASKRPATTVPGNVGPVAQVPTTPAKVAAATSDAAGVH